MCSVSPLAQVHRMTLLPLPAYGERPRLFPQSERLKAAPAGRMRPKVASLALCTARHSTWLHTLLRVKFRSWLQGLENQRQNNHDTSLSYTKLTNSDSFIIFLSLKIQNILYHRLGEQFCIVPSFRLEAYSLLLFLS
jgi:hypothetical protein